MVCLTAKTKDILIQAGIAIIGLLLFVPGLGAVHLFDWDEINFAESAREMLVTGDFLNVQINFRPFWEKPPLFIWMQALSMKIFGVNEFAARFPNAICGVCTLLVLFRTGRRLKDSGFGLLWVLLYAGSILPFFYFKSGIIDPWFNLFIFTGTAYFIRYCDGSDKADKMAMAVLSGLFLGLAVLTKGPVGFLLFVLTFFVFLCIRRFRFDFKWKHVAGFFAALCIAGGFWFVLLVINGKFSVIQDFIMYQIRLFETKDAGHGGFPFYHFVILFAGVFPASIIALPAFGRKVLARENDGRMALFFRWMMIFFWVVLLLFSIVRTKIIHYSSACYFPLTFLAAYITERYVRNEDDMPMYVKVLLSVFSVVYAAAVAIVTQFDKIKSFIIPYVADEFAVGNMQAESSWYGFEAFAGLLLLAGLVAALVLFARNRSFNGIAALSAGVMSYMFATTLFVAPQVEKYSQGAVIEFLESKKGEDCYICLPYYKSYAHYFYSDRQPGNNCDDREFLLRGALDKPCYIVLHDVEDQRRSIAADSPDAGLIYEKNGFAFYRREPSAK